MGRLEGRSFPEKSLSPTSPCGARSWGMPPGTLPANFQTHSQKGATRLKRRVAPQMIARKLRLYRPAMPVRWMPLTKYRWAKKKRINSGMIMAVEAAIIKFQLVEYRSLNPCRPMAMVHLLVSCR